MADTTLYGFNGSTYVRTARMVLHDKAVVYDQVPVNVLEGETRQPEHLKRHPFGKVPVLDIDGLRLRETDAICRYLEASRPDPALIPSDPKDQAAMAEIINYVNAYGYDALLGLAAYHMFPDFIGNPGPEFLTEQRESAGKLLELIAEARGDSAWLAGPQPSLADYFLAPLYAYVTQTEEADAVLSSGAMRDWWGRVQTLDAFEKTKP